MSLGHVYIVLELVGSAHLTFDDDRYSEFMCFDVPKVVRSPGCDHGHDEESRNGRDVKIDILDDYVRTPEVFREVSDIYEYPGVTGTPRGVYWAYWALVEEEEGQPGQPRAPSPSSPNWTRRGAAPPFPFLPPSLPSPLLLLLGWGESYSRWE